MMNYYANCDSDDDENYFRTNIVHKENLPQVNMAQHKFSDQPVHLDKLFKEEDESPVEKIKPRRLRDGYHGNLDPAKLLNFNSSNK